MQLLLIFGIGFAIAAVTFALQNNTPVSVSFALWRFDSSLAIVLLLALGLGVIIAGLLSSPAVIGGRWSTSRLRRQVALLESERTALTRRVGDLEAEVERLNPKPGPAPDEPKPYVGLTTLMTGGTSGTSSDRASG